MKAKLLAALVFALIAASIVLPRAHTVHDTPPRTQTPASGATSAPTSASGEMPSTQPAPAIAGTSALAPGTATEAARAAASMFASKYARYLEGSLPAKVLAPATATVRRTAAQAGPIPRALRGGWPTRLAVKGDEGPRKAIAVTDSNGHTYRAQITLTHTTSGWIVSELQPPSYAGVHPPAAPGGQPPVAAETAARAFFSIYVGWYYGQVRAGTIKDATRALRATLAAHPPRVPTLQRTLHPRVGTVWLQWARSTDQWHGWGAWAQVNDGQVTFYVGATMRPIGSAWLATSMIPTS